MKALKPSHREHKRYLLIKGKDASRENIENAIMKFIGLLGYAKASPQFVNLEDEKKRTCTDEIVVSINRQEFEKVRAALLLSGLDVKIVQVSGILKKF